MDLILLSYGGVVIAVRPSSFTQSMPLSLVMARENHTVSQPFCEMNPEGTDIRCYSSYPDWCYQGDTDFTLEELQQRCEYLRMPKSGYYAWDIYEKKRKNLDAQGCVPRPAGWKQACLPYNFEESLMEMRHVENIMNNRGKSARLTTRAPSIGRDNNQLNRLVRT